MRLFVAAELPADVRAQLAAAAPGPPWKPVREDALHVTLAFLGERPEPDVEVISAALGSCTARAAAAELGESLLLPPRRPRVCAVHVRSEGLMEVQRQVSGALVDAGVLTAPERPFLPHVTLARAPRVPSTGPRRGRRDPPRVGVDVSGAFTIGSVALYASHLGSPGPRYTALYRSTLQA